MAVLIRWHLCMVVSMVTTISWARGGTTTSEQQNTVTSTIPTTLPQLTLCNRSYTMHSDADRTCFPGIMCKYGKCDKSAGISCQCDDGAVGSFCTQECCLDCGENGNCFYNTLQKKEICNCRNNYMGERCETKIDPDPTQEPDCSPACPAGSVCTIVSGSSICSPVTTTTRAIEQSTRSGGAELLCGKPYQLRDLSERTCEGGLVCQRGYCSIVNGSTSCECDTGARGLICENECCKDCGDNGTCFYEARTNTEICNCFNGYTGDTCADVVTAASAIMPDKREDWYLWIVGVSIGVLLLLIVLLIVLPYVLWRHRVILVMKIVHYFQGYEDEDEREWDAFISYKSDPRDEHFVVKVLFPTLEKEMGFKTHVHFRDFVPGDTIANNIIRAVQGSRRTILVITPNFVQSEFTKFEYQVAQQEMLKHKHRIIPILLDDISDHKDTIDPNLKVILGSVTYLEWPEEQTEKKLAKFWKRLQLSLPKKRTLDDQAEDAIERKKSQKYKIPDFLQDDKQGEKKEKVMVIKIPNNINIGNENDMHAAYDNIAADNMDYEKIDEKYLDKKRNIDNEIRVNEDRYINILENTKL